MGGELMCGLCLSVGVIIVAFACMTACITAGKATLTKADFKPDAFVVAGIGGIILISIAFGVYTQKVLPASLELQRMSASAQASHETP